MYIVVNSWETSTNCTKDGKVEQRFTRSQQISYINVPSLGKNGYDWQSSKTIGQYLQRSRRVLNDLQSIHSGAMILKVFPYVFVGPKEKGLTKMSDLKKRSVLSSHFVKRALQTCLAWRKDRSSVLTLWKGPYKDVWPEEKIGPQFSLCEKGLTNMSGLKKRSVLSSHFVKRALQRCLT